MHKNIVWQTDGSTTWTILSVQKKPKTEESFEEMFQGPEHQPDFT